MSTSSITFTTLVRERYLAAGFSKEQAFSKVFLESGVSRGTIRAAFNETRIAPESAEALGVWALKVHRVQLDELALVKAPTKPQRRAFDQVLGRLTLVTLSRVEGSDEMSVRLRCPSDISTTEVAMALEEHMAQPTGGV